MAAQVLQGAAGEAYLVAQAPLLAGRHNSLVAVVAAEEFENPFVGEEMHEADKRPVAAETLAIDNQSVAIELLAIDSRSVAIEPLAIDNRSVVIEALPCNRAAAPEWTLAGGLPLRLVVHSSWTFCHA
jgi:hypothetical protein